MSKTGWWGDKIIVTPTPKTDERRHKKQCLYLKKSTGLCTLKGYKCVGSAHCESYEHNDLTDKR